MKLGVALPLSERTIPVTEAGRAAEERGFESMWVGEHSHLPVATVHRYTKGRYGQGASARDGRVPDMYQRFLDPFVVLAAAAAVTSTIRIGTAISLAAERSVLHLAKEVATLDLQSGGRFEFGVGYGWNDLELRNNGIDPRRRRDVLREKVEALRLLWTQETAAYQGEFVAFEESWSFPKPVQKPHPPILLGAGASASTFAEVARWADGWMPVKAMAAGNLATCLAELRQIAVESGRDPGSLTVTLIDPEASFAGKRDYDRFAAALPGAEETEVWASLGVDRLVIRIPADDRDLLYRALDHVSDSMLKTPAFSV